jgi:hypothetical protein
LSTDFGETQDVIVEERVVLEKFDGEPKPENLIERLHLLDGKIVQHDFIEGGEVVESHKFGGDE